MTRNGLLLRALLVAAAALSTVIARADAQQPGNGWPANGLLIGIPTTLATLANDSEGLTVDPDMGVLYAAQGPNSSGDCLVSSITLGGVVSTVGTVPKPSGGACAPRGLEFRAGHLYISDQGSGAEGWVFEMDPLSGQATVFASGVPGANGIAFDSRGNLWITDALRGLGRVYRREAMTGNVEEVFRVPPVANGTTYGGRRSTPTASGIGRLIANVPGMQSEVKAVANGIAVIERYDEAALANGAGQPRFATLFIADTARGAIWAARLDENGDLAPGQTGCDPTLQDDTLCDEALFVADPRLEGADGMWADKDGSLWVAANGRQAIVLVSPRGHVTELFRNPVNSQLLRSSADTPQGNAHILEYPTNPVIVPSIGSPQTGTVCVASTDRPGRDNWPGTTGEIGGAGQPKGKVSCFPPR